MIVDRFKDYISNTEKHILFKKAFFISLFFHILAVIFSDGFHRPDEHLGIFRLMSFKLGNFPEDKLSWEFGAMIRPWIHPYAFYLVTKLLNFLGVTNPYFISGFLRLICSSIGFYATYKFTLYSFKYVKTEFSQKIIVILMASMWYLPFFHARTTAENLSLSFFIFGLLNIDSNSDKISSYIKAGLFFALSYIFRFQSGVMVAFAMLWPLFSKKIDLSKFSISALSLILFIGLSSVIDYIGYGEWTFTSWNYVYQNIFKGVASGFGVSPWYYYLDKSLAKGVPPYSLFLIGSLIWLWIKKPLHYLTWITLPFIVIHSAIGHKELRFIFGIGIFAPVAFAIFLESGNLNILKNKFIRALASLAIIGNIGALVIASTKPAYTPLSFYKHLYNKEEQIKDLYTLSLIRDELLYYQKEPFNQIYVEKQLESFFKSLALPSSSKWIFTSNFKYILRLEELEYCRRDFSTYPSFLLDKKYSKIFKKSKIWTLYHCRN